MIKRILLIGLILFLTGTVLLMFLPIKSNSENIIASSFESLPTGVLLFFVVGLAPLLEELSFRVWVVKNRFSKVLTVFGVSSFFYLSFSNIWVLLGALGASVALSFVFAKNSNERLFFAIWTSVFFGIAHLPGYGFNFETIGPIIQLTGLGFLLSSIGLKFGLKYSILSHVVYNLTVFLLMSNLFSSEESSVTFEEYKVNIESISFLKEHPDFNKINPDSSFLVGSRTEIIKKILPAQGRIRYKTPFNDFSNVGIQSQPSSALYEYKVALGLVEYWDLKLDTNEVSSYFLEVNDKYALNCEKCSYQTSVKDFMEYLEFKFRVPIYADDLFLDKEIQIKISFLEIKSLDLAIQKLKKDYGFILYMDPNRATSLVTIHF